MNILEVILLILLTMVSYSAGITLAARRRPYEPALLDLLLVAGLWVVLFWLRPQLSRLPMLAVAIGSGIAVGYIIGTYRLSGIDLAKKIPDSELPEHAREKATSVRESNLFKRVWRRWNDFAERMGVVQGRIFMGFFYFVVVTPFGLVVRLLADPLKTKQEPVDTNWTAKEVTETTIDAAREQG